MKHVFKYLKITVFIALVVLSSIGMGQEINHGNLKYKPKNLEEAVSQLSIVLSDSTKQEISSMTEEEFVGNAHLSLGMWIRNEWRLWKGGDLADYFESMGIFHPDDMSGIILTSYYRELQGQEWQVDEQVQHCKQFWNERQDYIYRLENDTAFAHAEKERYEQLNREMNERTKNQYPIGTQVRAWVDYSILGDRSEVVGEIIGWRSKQSSVKSRIGSSQGPLVTSEFLEANIRIIEYKDIKKQKRIERYIKRHNGEMWVSASLIEPIE